MKENEKFKEFEFLANLLVTGKCASYTVDEEHVSLAINTVFIHSTFQALLQVLVRLMLEPNYPFSISVTINFTDSPHPEKNSEKIGLSLVLHNRKPQAETIEQLHGFLCDNLCKIKFIFFRAFADAIYTKDDDVPIILLLGTLNQLKEISKCQVRDEFDYALLDNTLKILNYLFGRMQTQPHIRTIVKAYIPLVEQIISYAHTPPMTYDYTTHLHQYMSNNFLRHLSVASLLCFGIINESELKTQEDGMQYLSVDVSKIRSRQHLAFTNLLACIFNAHQELNVCLQLKFLPAHGSDQFTTYVIDSQKKKSMNRAILRDILANKEILVPKFVALAFFKILKINLCICPPEFIFENTNYTQAYFRLFDFKLRLLSPNFNIHDHDAMEWAAVHLGDIRFVKYLVDHGHSLESIINKHEEVGAVISPRNDSLSLFVKYRPNILELFIIAMQKNLDCGLHAIAACLRYLNVSNIPANSANVYENAELIKSLRTLMYALGIDTHGPLFDATQVQEIIAAAKGKSIIVNTENYEHFVFVIEQACKYKLPLLMPYACNVDKNATQDEIAISAHWAALIGQKDGNCLLATWGTYSEMSAENLYQAHMQSAPLPLLYNVQGLDKQWRLMRNLPKDLQGCKFHLFKPQSLSNFWGKMIIVTTPQDSLIRRNFMVDPVDLIHGIRM